MSDDPGWRASRWRRAQAAAIVAAGVPAIELLGATYRWRVAGAHWIDALAREGTPPILTLWHEGILAATLYFRDLGVVAIASRNFDGEWIARLLHRFGYGTARGSTSRGGARALVELRRALEAGHPVAFTVDGPRGPARVAQPGAMWLAGATGCPVVPFHIEAARAWRARSWDRHLVPKPGSTVAIAIGEPIDVAPGADEAAIERARQEVQAALRTLRAKAIALANA